jgi:3-oxoacyl-[acyl-carrier-protein] synthase-3
LRAGVSNAVVVATEALSPVLDPADLKNALLFGDGAAALVLERCEDDARGLLCARMGNADVRGRAFTVPGELPPTVATVEAGGYVFQAPDEEYGRGLAELRRKVADELGQDATRLGVTIDVAIPYAVSAPQARAQAEAMRVPPERVVSPLTAHGCLGAAAPLVAMSEAGKGVVALCAAGGGVAWGSVLWRS